MSGAGPSGQPTPPWTRAWRGDALAAAAGAVLPFAFSPFFLWPLAPLSLAALLVAWCGGSTRRAVWRGWLFGLAAFGAGVSWIVSSFQFSNIALPIALVLTVGFVAFLALYPALVGYASARLAVALPLPVRLLAVLPALWIVGEWLRGWLLTGFTWLQLGYSQVDGPLAGWLPVGGVYGAGLAVAVVAGGLAWTVLAPGPRPAGALAAVLLAASLVAQVGNRDWTQPAGPPLEVALVQGNVPQDQKWRPEMRAPTLERYMQLTAPHLGADLLVWPETAVPGQEAMMQPFIQELGRVAARAGSSVLFGIPEYSGTPFRAYNTVLMVGAHGGRYRKRHLVPFGEYLPLDTVLRPITRALGIPVSNFSPGAAVQPPLQVAGHRVAMFVCYEIAFGNEVAAALPAATLLATVSNDAWFGDSIGPHQHLQMARARALETGRELVRATNTGITALVDARGRVGARLEQFSAASLHGQVTPRAGATPYVRWGDLPALVLCALLLAPCLAARRRGR